MSITGTGTELDPLLVHNYDELKEACETAGDWLYENRIRYVRLVEDIDWNNDGRTWERIKLGLTSGSSVTFVTNLDFYGHTIKNVLLENERNMFLGVYMNNTTYSSIESTNGSGKLLNIFSNGSYGIVGGHNTSGNGAYTPQQNNVCPIKNISMSVNATSMKSAAFVGCYFENCALYYVNSTPSETSNKGTYGIVANRYYSAATYKDFGGDMFKNCDLYLDISNIDVYKMSTVFYNQQSSDTGMTDCRISGKLSSIDENGTIVKDGFLFDRSYGYLHNCVVDIEANVSYGHFFYGKDNGNTGVVNGEKMRDRNGDYLYDDGGSHWGITYARDNHIKDADWLNAHSFNVVPVG